MGDRTGEDEVSGKTRIFWGGRENPKELQKGRGQFVHPRRRKRNKA